MKESESVGARVKRYRNLRGMDQHQLAAKSGVSYSMVTKVESGHASPSAFTVGKIAAALNIDSSRLYADEEHEQTLDIVPVLRRTLFAADLLPDDLEPEPLDQLRRKVEQVGVWRRGTQYKKIGEVLPDLVEHLLLAGQQEGEPAYALLVDAYRAANSLAHKLGYIDLSTVATERMESAAVKSGDPLRVASVSYLKAATLARLGEGKHALRLLDRAMAQIEHLVGNDPVAAAVYSTLHMRAGTIAATLADADASRSHLAEAARLAATFPDQVVYDTVVGATNVKLFQIAAETDLGNAERAVEISLGVQLPKGYAKERQTYFWLDSARAHLLAGEPDQAIEALLESRAVAPEHFRSSPTVKATVRAAADQQRVATDTLRSLANSANIQD